MTQSEGYTECSAIWKIKVVDLWELMVNHNFKMDDMARLKNVARNQGDLFMERMRNVKRKRSDNEDATQVPLLTYCIVHATNHASMQSLASPTFATIF